MKNFVQQDLNWGKLRQLVYSYQDNKKFNEFSSGIIAKKQVLAGLGQPHLKSVGIGLTGKILLKLLSKTCATVMDRWSLVNTAIVIQKNLLKFFSAIIWKNFLINNSGWGHYVKFKVPSSSSTELKASLKL